MKTKRKNKLLHKLCLFAVIVATIGLVFVVAGRFRLNREASREIDPHLGMAEVFNGESYVWILPEAGVPVNPFGKADFTADENGAPCYNGTDYAAFRGVDVSEHQGDIDWSRVKQSGIDFAIIRVGGRGYGENGKLVADEKFEKNLEGAKAAGLKVGVYFFSQAMNAEEAEEEARFALELIDGAELQLPVYFDWEHIVFGEPARTDKVSGAVVTDCAIAFCDAISDAGYKTGIYTNLDMSYYGYKMERLADYNFWTAAVGSYPYAYYAFSVWQYSFKGDIPGINAPCDMDMMFVEYS